jgi:hypothetical protein
MSRTRPRGFETWSPRPSTLEFLAAVRGVLREYHAYLPLTIRQIFYRLVGTTGYDKTEAAYERLCETLNRARRAGLIPFSAIRDDGGSRLDPDFWDGPEQLLRQYHSAAAALQLDRQDGQPVRLWLLCEAAGMAPMLARAAHDFGVPVLSSGGFDSLTAKYHLSKELAEVDAPVEVLHIGDLDPSGEHLFSALAEDVSAMVLGLGGGDPKFTRLAVTRAQVSHLGLPTAPPKSTDRRSFDGETAQAEAIPPDILTSIVVDAIEARRDAEAFGHVLARELEVRQFLLARLRSGVS